MSLQPSSPDLSQSPEQQEAAEVGDDMRYFRRVLRHLIEIGDDLAELIEQDAKHQAAARADAATCSPSPQTPPPPAIAPHNVDAYERITCSVRRSMMLYQKLAAPAKKPSAERRTAARKCIIRAVEDVIHDRAPDEDQESLHAEFIERLERPELDDEIANRSIAEIVTDICRDLGIAGLPSSHPWQRRTPHDIAILNARAAQLYGQAPSAELAALLATAPPRPPRRTADITDIEIDPATNPYRHYTDEELDAVIRRHAKRGQR